MSVITAPAGFAVPSRARVRPARRTSRALGTEQAQGPLRLTRRGRLLRGAGLLLLILAVLASAVLATGDLATAGVLGGGGDAPTRMVTVRPGETLWLIAQRTAPGVDPRETVAEIMDLNALPTSTVPAGSVLLLPR